MNSTDHRTAVVTGGASGMGLSCAERFLDGGMSVALVDFDETALDDAVGALGRHRGRVIGVRTDVTVAADVAKAVGVVEASLGPTSVLVNAAGVLRPTRFEDISEEEWDFVVNVSLKGTFLASQAFLPHLRSSPQARIVNFSSTAGKTVSTLGGAHYTAAKSALLGLTRAMAKELAADGITVNAVCPGLIDTAMVRSTMRPAERSAIAESFPITRLGRPDEVAALVAFLCSVEGGYITGAALDINGGDLMV